ncbi:Histidine kinase [Novosphingobium lubricantis]|jgi:hypothetical protein
MELPDVAAIKALIALPGALLALQAAGSLLAILALARLARGLGLGGDPRIEDEDHARLLAGQALDGFDARAVSVDRAGMGALLRDAQGRVLVLRRHGSHFAARLLTSHAGVRLDGRFLSIATADRRFGTVVLDLGEQAQVWAASLRRLGTGAP